MPLIFTLCVCVNEGLTLLLGIVCATGSLRSITSSVDNKAEEFGWLNCTQPFVNWLSAIQTAVHLSVPDIKMKVKGH